VWFVVISAQQGLAAGTQANRGALGRESVSLGFAHRRPSRAVPEIKLEEM